MTKREFAQGWKLLILQPWGWRYRTLTPQGTPSEESQTQLDFYYSKLSWAHADAWREVAERYAQGEEWPSLDALKLSLRHANLKNIKLLTPPMPVHEEIPPEVREMLSKIGRKM